MKLNYLTFILCFICFLSCNINPKVDIYKENHIRYEYLYGEKDSKGKVSNDRNIIDIYIPDYSKTKAEEVINFYLELDKPMADKKDDKLTLIIHFWNKKIDKNDTESERLGKLYNKGTFVYNYKNKFKSLNFNE